MKRLSIKTCDSRSVLHLQVDVCDKQSFMSSRKWRFHPFKSITCCMFAWQGRTRPSKVHHLTLEENGGNTVNHIK